MTAHVDVDFEDEEVIDDCRSATEDGPPDETPCVIPKSGGPLMLRGEFEIESAVGESASSGTETVLCRWGASGEKPFCDGSHGEIGFTDEDEGDVTPRTRRARLVGRS